MGSGEHSLPQPLSVADELAQFKSRWLTKHSNMTFAGEQSRTEIRSGAEWKMHTVPAVPQHDGVRAASEAMFRQCISWPEKKKLKSKFSSVKSCRSYILFISFSGWRQQSLQLQVKSCPAPLLSVAQHTSPAHPSPAGICFVLVLEPSLSLFDSKAKTAITEFCPDLQQGTCLCAMSTWWGSPCSHPKSPLSYINLPYATTRSSVPRFALCISTQP